MEAVSLPGVEETTTAQDARTCALFARLFRRPAQALLAEATREAAAAQPGQASGAQPGAASGEDMSSRCAASSKYGQTPRYAPVPTARPIPPVFGPPPRASAPVAVPGASAAPMGPPWGVGRRPRSPPSDAVSEFSDSATMSSVPAHPEDEQPTSDAQMGESPWQSGGGTEANAARALQRTDACVEGRPGPAVPGTPLVNPRGSVRAEPTGAPRESRPRGAGQDPRRDHRRARGPKRRRAGDGESAARGLSAARRPFPEPPSGGAQPAELYVALRVPEGYPPAGQQEGNDREIPPPGGAELLGVALGLPLDARGLGRLQRRLTGILRYDVERGTRTTYWEMVNHLLAGGWSARPTQAEIAAAVMVSEERLACEWSPEGILVAWATGTAQQAEPRSRGPRRRRR